MEKIALLPGGFKPPHAGHYNMAKWLAANTDADTIVIKVGSKERDGITREMSLKLWNLYRLTDPDSPKLAILASEKNSPVADVYDFIEEEAPEGSKIYLGAGEKDKEDSRYNNISKFADPKNIEFEIVLVPPQAGGVSGTEMRNFIKDNNKESFQKYLPEHLTSEQKDEAWNIVSKKIDEDFYDKNNATVNFMKSSEYKAGMPDGHKEDMFRFGDRRHNRQTSPVVYEQQGRKILHVYDFDDTIARVTSNIKTIITSPNDPDFFRELDISSEDFPEKSKELETELEGFDVTYDFSEFEKQISDAIINTGVVDKLKASLSNPQIKTTILTARSIGHPVTRYMREELGLEAYVVPLGLQIDGKVTGQDKANWVENHIDKGYSTIYFIDDSEDNRKAVLSLKDKYPDISLTVENPKDLNELMYGTMTKQEMAKHKKNLKRLKKDLKKQGDQYMEVPNYLKGTLKRKLYNEQFRLKSSDDPYNIGHYTTSALSINDKTIPLEVMRTPTDQTIGMMDRDELKGGMIFPYDEVSKKDFHMENCLIPLDIVFINKGTIDTIHSNCPPCKKTPCPKYSGMADNVLELPGNYCKKHNTNIGDKVNLNLTERKLTKGELKDRERIAKDLPDKEFKKRYGKDWKSVKLATATKLAKKEEGLYPKYTANQVQKVRYKASDVFTGDYKKAEKMGYLEGDTYEKMAVKGKKKGNLKQGTVRKRLKIKAGDKIPLSKINKAISRIKKMKNPSEKNKKYLKALNLAKTLKTTTHKENIDPKAQAKHKGKSAPYGSAYEPVNEADPKKGTGKKPKGSGRRLYTDENPKDTVKVKFSTRQDIVDTLTKKSFKSKPHKRQSQIINLIHQRVRAALSRTKDPQKKKRLKSAFEYIKKRKEASKRKTQRMKKESALTKGWWKNIINEMLLKEGGAAGHMAHPFNLPDVNSGKDLKDIFNKSAESLQNDPGSVKIDGVNSSIRLIDLDGEKQFVMDRGSKKELDVKGITKDDLLSRFGDGHGMVKIGGEVLDMFNKALPSIKGDLEKLGAYDNPNILFNMEYVSGKTNVQDYGSNFIVIHGLNKIETKEVQGKRKMLTKRVSSEISYDKSALQSLLDNLAPIAKEQGFEVYGSVPTEMTKKPNFSSALSQNYTIVSNEGEKTQTLDAWLNELNNIPEEDFIFINIDNSRKKVGAVSKQVYVTLLKGGNIDELFETEDDKQKAIEGFTTYLATEKLGDEVLKVLDSPMGSVENHEGVVIRDEKITNVPFKITGKFILGGLASDF